jgi:hypothetical protein
MEKSETFEDVDVRLKKRASTEGDDWETFKSGKNRGMSTFTTSNPLGSDTGKPTGKKLMNTKKKNAAPKKKDDVQVFSLASLQNPAKEIVAPTVQATRKLNLNKKNRKQLSKRRNGKVCKGDSHGTHEPGPLVTSNTTNKKTSSRLRKLLSSSSMTTRFSGFMSRRSTGRSSLLEEGTRSDTIEDQGPVIKTQNGKVVQVVQVL